MILDKTKQYKAMRGGKKKSIYYFSIQTFLILCKQLEKGTSAKKNPKNSFLQVQCLAAEHTACWPAVFKGDTLIVSNPFKSSSSEKLDSILQCRENPKEAFQGL